MASPRIVVLFHYKSPLPYLLTSRNMPFRLFFFSLSSAYRMIPAAHSIHTGRTSKTGDMPRT